MVWLKKVSRHILLVIVCALLVAPWTRRDSPLLDRVAPYLLRQMRGLKNDVEMTIALARLYTPGNARPKGFLTLLRANSD